MLRVYLTSVTPYSSDLRSARSDICGEHCILCGFPLPLGSRQSTSCATLNCCQVLIIGAVCTGSSYHSRRQVPCCSVLHILCTEYGQFQLQMSVLELCGLCRALLCSALRRVLFHPDSAVVPVLARSRNLLPSISPLKPLFCRPITALISPVHTSRPFFSLPVRSPLSRFDDSVSVCDNPVDVEADVAVDDESTELVF